MYSFNPEQYTQNKHICTLIYHTYINIYKIICMRIYIYHRKKYTIWNGAGTDIRRCVSQNDTRPMFNGRFFKLPHICSFCQKNLVISASKYAQSHTYHFKKKLHLLVAVKFFELLVHLKERNLESKHCNQNLKVLKTKITRIKRRLFWIFVFL